MYMEVKTVLLRPIVPILACLVFATLIIWQVWAGILLVLSADMSAGTNDSMRAEREIATRSHALNKGLQMPFFGEHVPESLHDANIKQSMLDLDVVGILFADNEQNSQVIIRTAGGQDKIFSVGDSLPGGVIIKRITPEGVLVGRNGSLESLSFPKNELIFEPPAKPLIGE